MFLTKAWPYVLVAIMIAVQGALVAFIAKVIAPALHIANYGGLLAWTLFVLGGWALGLIELHHVREGEKFSDPLHIACCWTQRRLRLLGYVLNSLLMGSMGASIALKQAGYNHLKVRSFIAAVLFATLWIPLYLEVPFFQ